MIRMQYKDGRYAPVILCDICEQRISQVGKGAVVFARRRSPPIENELLEIFHVHKGQCDDKAEQRFDPALAPGWQELKEHLLYLTHNCGFPADDLAAYAEFLSDLHEQAGTFDE